MKTPHRVLLGVLLASSAFGQLYGGTQDVTGGDLDDQDYWWARFDDLMLDVALKARQPEGRIGYQLVGSLKRLDELLVRFPNHDGIKKMKDHAQGIVAKIDPKAERNAALAPE